MNKIVCYTAITNGYDSLREPLYITPGIDYICFSDHPLSSIAWKIRPIPCELMHLSKVKQQRVLKICPHKYLPEYETSIWIDGNILLKSDLTHFIAQYDLQQCGFYVRKHPSRDCIYDESQICLKLHKDTPQNILPQIAEYRNAGFPEHNGLVETNILLRKHNTIECQLIDNMWATEVLGKSHRDQLSFNYVCWKQSFNYGELIFQKYIIKNRSEFFEWAIHHDK